MFLRYHILPIYSIIKSFFVGVPRFELGLHAPKASVLPLHHTPNTSFVYHIFVARATGLWYNVSI